MLSKLLLLFDEKEMATKYALEKKEFYKKSVPILTLIILCLSITIECLYRAGKYGDITILTSCINWGAFLAFIVLSILVRYVWYASWLICPILTSLTFYYFAYIDYERT